MGRAHQAGHSVNERSLEQGIGVLGDLVEELVLEKLERRRTLLRLGVQTETNEVVEALGPLLGALFGSPRVLQGRWGILENVNYNLAKEKG